jgi:DNA polymerase III delta subunit
VQDDLVALAGTGNDGTRPILHYAMAMVHYLTGDLDAAVAEAATGETLAQELDTGLARTLARAIVAASLALAEQLTTGGEDRPSKLVWPIVRRLRDVHRAAELLDAGMPEAKVAQAMKMPPWAAKRALAQAKKADREVLARALCAFADLEIELRGGGVGLDEETAFSLTLTRAAAGAAA